MITPAWTTLRPHPVQSQLWRCKTRFAAVAAGRGSGKTELARRRVVRFLPVKKPWPDPMYFYALPTYAQAQRVAWRALLRLIPPDWIKGEPNKSAMTVETIFGSMLYVIGLDKPARAEGVQWDGGVIDESSDQKPGIFHMTFTPAFSHRKAWCWRIGVPKRAGIGAADFKAFFDRGGQDPDISSYTWKSSTVLSPEELRFAQENLDEKDYREQYDASWEDASGTVFHAFHEVLNIREVTYHPNLPLLIGSDFNVSPMSWVIGQEIGNELHVFDEIFVNNTNTQATLNELYKRYGTHENGFCFYGDASGRARKTSASESDYAQIKNDRRFKNSRVFYPMSNPARADRFSSCNMMFCNALGIRRCFIHPRCKYLIKDLKQRAYAPGTNEPDDYGDIGHITDALGYLIHAKWPVRFIIPRQTPHIVTT